MVAVISWLLKEGLRKRQVERTGHSKSVNIGLKPIGFIYLQGDHEQAPLWVCGRGTAVPSPTASLRPSDEIAYEKAFLSYAAINKCALFSWNLNFRPEHAVNLLNGWINHLTSVSPCPYLHGEINNTPRITWHRSEDRLGLKTGTHSEKQRAPCWGGSSKCQWRASGLDTSCPFPRAVQPCL